MVIERRDVWWADLEEPRGSQPGFRRPVLIVQANPFNRSRLRTTMAVVLSSNLRLLDAPGNVLLPSSVTGLPKDSAAVVTQLVTLDQDYLAERVGQIPPRLMTQVDRGLRVALDL
jgi:mRNA interferase MazF